MNSSSARTAGIILTSLVLGGCQTYTQYTSPGAPPPKLTRVAIVINPYSKEKRHIAADIVNVLQTRGIETILVAPGDQPPKDVDGYFTYNDEWQWDVIMYLSAFEIQLHDTSTGKVIASASYKEGAFHGFPSPTVVADRLVGKILGEPPKAGP